MSELPNPDELCAGGIPVAFDLFQALKDATSTIHEQTERRVPVFRPDFNRRDYTHLIEQCYGFWAPVEAKLTSLESLGAPDLALVGRLKSPLLRVDLIFLGRNPDDVRADRHALT